MTKKWSPEECAEDPVRASNVIDDYRGNLSLANAEIQKLHGYWSEALANVTARNEQIEQLKAYAQETALALHRQGAEIEGLRNQLRVMAALGDRREAERTLAAHEPVTQEHALLKALHEIALYQGHYASDKTPTARALKKIAVDAIDAFHEAPPAPGPLQASLKSEGRCSIHGPYVILTPDGDYCPLCGPSSEPLEPHG